MNGKQQALSFLSKGSSIPEGVIFMPRFLGYGANLNRITPEEMRNDAGKFLKSLQKEEELLCPDLLVLNYDLTYLAEMAGCQVKMTQPYEWEIVSYALEDNEAEWADFALPSIGNSGRLSLYRDVLAVIKKSSATPVVSLVPTPFTLSRQLAGESFLRSIQKGEAQSEDLMDAALYTVCDTTKIFLDAGSDSILFYEDLSNLQQGSLSATLMDFYRTLFNVLNHYQKRALFCISGKLNEIPEVYKHEAVAGICFSEQTPQNIALPRIGADRPISGSGSSVDFQGTDEQLVQKITGDFAQIKQCQSYIFSPLIPAHVQPEKVFTFAREIHSRKTRLLEI